MPTPASTQQNKGKQRRANGVLANIGLCVKHVEPDIPCEEPHRECTGVLNPAESSAKRDRWCEREGRCPCIRNKPRCAPITCVQNFVLKMAAYCDEYDKGECTAVTTDTWKGQLDFDRDCTGPEQRCWLCTELTPWNRVMHELALELVELRPGKLRLWSMQHGVWKMWTRRPTAAAKTSFLVSWLLQHHRCIDELKVADGAYPTSWRHTPFPIRLLPATGSDSRRTIRHLEVEANACSWWCFSMGYALHRLYELSNLDVVDGLERLKLQFHEMIPGFATELGRLVRRNASSIKRFEIAYLEVPHQVDDALQYLLSCESLTCHRLPSMQSVARLLLSSTALKELTISYITSTTQIAALGKELETNTSLTKLDVGMRDRCSLAAVFTALQVNTTLRELRVTNCSVNEECGQALALLLQKNTGLRLLYIRDAYVSDSSPAVLVAALAKNTTLESLHISSGMLPMNGIAELCQVLRVNKALKKLRFTDLECPKESRRSADKGVDVNNEGYFRQLYLAELTLHCWDHDQFK